MEIRKCPALLASAVLMALALLSGCGSSSSTSTTIPSVATIYYAHSVIFRNNSTMTMGYNGFGQLGDGTLTTRATAAIVPGLGHMDGFASGAEHTLVFGNNSSVMAWGYNSHGQLGNSGVVTGATNSTSDYSAKPVKVGSLRHVTSVAAGAFHSLAVSDGSVWSWGYNGYGQLGDGPLGLLADSSTPKQVQLVDNGVPINNVKQVAAGGSHSLALTADGKVFAWGNNASGQLGGNPLNLNGIYSPTPAPVNDASGSPLSNVVQIAAAGSTSYALRDDGTGKLTVWAWGYNGSGQLGRNPAEIAATATTAAVAATPYSFIPVQVMLADGTPVIATKISAGLDHVLALLADGSVLAWGFNQYSQLGDNTITSNYRPVQVLKDGTAANGPLAGVTDIIAFGHHSLALAGSAWYGWGDNGSGQLGYPISTTSIGYLLVPHLVQGF